MKQLIYGFVSLKVLTKAMICIYFLVTGVSQLPAAVFGVTIALVIAGAVASARYYAGKGTANELIFFFSAELVATIFNLMFVYNMSLLQTGMLDIIVTGSLFDVIIATVVILMVRRVKKDIDTNRQSFSPQTAEASHTKA